MIAILAASASFQMFAPVIAVSAATVGLLALNRFAMSRKVHVARSSSDPLLEMSDCDSFSKVAPRRSAPAEEIAELRVGRAVEMIADRTADPGAALSAARAQELAEIAAERAARLVAEFVAEVGAKPATPEPFERSPIVELHLGAREDETTIRFVRGRRGPSPADSASMTLEAERVYLEPGELIAC